MLVLEAGFSQISWSIVHDGVIVDGGSETCKQAEIPGHILELVSGADTIAYVLVNGGDAFPDPVTNLGPDELATLARVIPLFPPTNRITFLMAQAGLRDHSEFKQYILCETAYFRDMPLKASGYALPSNFSTKGLRRYGGDGLFHQWAWAEACRQPGRLQRLVTVHLGDYPNTAAQFEGRPVDTSLGFSALDGIPSISGCGEIDPGIVLLLAEGGMQLDEIERTLMRESGLTALIGRSARWVEIAGSPNPQTLQTRQMLLNQVVKSIGSSLAVLGGVDAIVFGCEDVTTWLGFIHEICLRLEFAGVKPVAAYEDRGYWRLTSSESSIQLYGFNYPRSLALAKLVAS